MPVVNWVARGQVPAGFLSRFQMSYPSQFIVNVGGQRQFNVQAAWAVALQHLQAQQIPMPPGMAFDPFPVANSEEPPRLLMVQVEMPTVARTQHNAPYGQPVGHGPVTPPPQVMPREQVGKQQGGFETLDPSALPSAADPTFGEGDGLGGTYTDIDSQGNEQVRDPNLIRPAMQRGAR